MRAHGRNQHVLRLSTACLAQFMVMLDVTVVTTVLPSIRDALRFSGTALPWVVVAYNVTFGGLLLVGGRAADRFGSRRMVAIGMVGFSLGSLVCALSPSPSILIGGRVVQGMSAAGLSPAALASLTGATQEGARRRRALSWWTAAGASGAATGWMLGGLATQFVGWPAVFWINLPFGLVGLAGIVLATPSSMSTRPGSLGLLPGGLATLTIGGGLLVLTDLGDGSVGVTFWVAAGCGIVSAILFRTHERRSVSPLLGRALLRTPGVRPGNTSILLLSATTTTVMYVAVFEVQQRLALGPAQAALLFPIFNLALVLGSLTAPRLVRCTTLGVALTLGFVCIAVAAGVGVAMGSSGVAVPVLLTTFTVLGYGTGTASVAALQCAVGVVRAGDRGVASGLSDVSMQMGAAIGLAAITHLITAPPDRFNPTTTLVSVAIVAACSTALARTIPAEAGPRPATGRARSLATRAAIRRGPAP